MQARKQNLEKFEQLSEARESCFCEYTPPAPGHRFSTLSIVFLKQFDSNEVGAIIDFEIKHWFGRFDYPLMVSAFDSAEDVLEIPLLEGARHILVWRDPISGSLTLSKNLSDTSFEASIDKAFPDRFRVFRGLKFETAEDRDSRIMSMLGTEKKQASWLKWLLLLWFLVIPTAWLLATSFGPNWLAVAVTVYAIFQVWWHGSRILGWRKPTTHEQVSSAEDLQMRHHHYHCKINPSGFDRLKHENLTREIIDSNMTEHRRLKDGGQDET